MREALFILNPLEGAGLQAQIREMLVSAILSRRLTPGEALPSTRAMAQQLNVARNTVMLAYQALVEDGYLEARDRSGFYVSGAAPAGELNTEPDAGALAAMDWEARLVTRYQGPPLQRKPVNWREFPYPFVYGQADPDLFSHSEWRDCARQALGKRNFEAMTGDFGVFDDPLLVDYICARTLPQRGILARPEQVLITLGAQNALYLLTQLLVGPQTTVAIEDPGYPDLRAALLTRTAHVIPAPVDADGLQVDARLARAEVIFVTPSHQCPTTVTMPIARRRALLAAAAKSGAVIVEDDYEFEMSFLGPPAPALKSLDRDGRVIYVGSFSKSVFPGLRLGYMVAPAPVIREARALRAMMLRHPPGLAQRTVAYFLALGHHQALIRRLQAAFAERRAVAEAALAEWGLTQSRAAKFGGASFWIGGPPSLDTEALKTTLMTQGVLIEPGAPFFAQPPLTDAPGARNHIRLAYSSIPAERIPEGIARIAKAIGAAQK